MKLHSIEIKNFRSLFSDSLSRPFQTELADGLNVIVGPNNVGKSNILRALALALDPSTSFDRGLDLPGQLRNNAVPTITLEMRRTQATGPEDTLFRYAEAYERSRLLAGKPSYASDGRLRFQIQLRSGQSGIPSRVERIQVRGQGAISGDPVLQDKVIRQLRDVVRFVYIESGSDVQRLLQGRFRDILHSLLGEHRKRELEDARSLQAQFARDIEDSLLAPLSDLIAHGLGGLFKDIRGVSLVPSLPSIDQLLEGVAIRLEDSVPTALSSKGTGVRGGVLISLLRYLAEQSRRSIFFAIEEPEAFLHPAAQESLLQDVRGLAERDDCSVIVTTHSPYLVPTFSNSKVFAVSKDLSGRTHIMATASGDDERAAVMSGLFRDAGLASAIERATRIPKDSRAVLLVEGWTDSEYIRIAAAALGRTEWLAKIHVVFCEGTIRLTTEAIVRRAQTELPMVILLDSDPPGKETYDRLRSKRFGFSNAKHLVPCAEAYGKDIATEAEVEDLFPFGLLQKFVRSTSVSGVTAGEPVFCSRLNRRRWTLTKAGKEGFISYLKLQRKLPPLPAWAKLFDAIERRIQAQATDLSDD